MKVIFLQNVSGVGRVGEVKEVANGYGRNFLIPRKFAVLPTPEIIKKVERQLQQEVQRQQRLAAELEEMARKLEGLSITFKVKTSTLDRTYGSIRDVHIAQEIARLTGFDIDKGSIELEEPLQQLGSYEVTIRLRSNLTPRIKVTVEEE